MSYEKSINDMIKIVIKFVIGFAVFCALVGYLVAKYS